MKPVGSPLPAVSSAPSAARYASASRPVVGACIPPARGAAAPGGAVGGAEPPSAPCSPVATGWSRGARSTHPARWRWSYVEDVRTGLIDTGFTYILVKKINTVHVVHNDTALHCNWMSLVKLLEDISDWDETNLGSPSCSDASSSSSSLPLYSYSVSSVENNTGKSH